MMNLKHAKPSSIPKLRQIKSDHSDTNLYLSVASNIFHLDSFQKHPYSAYPAANAEEHLQHAK